MKESEKKQKTDNMKIKADYCNVIVIVTLITITHYINRKKAEQQQKRKIRSLT